MNIAKPAIYCLIPGVFLILLTSCTGLKEAGSLSVYVFPTDRSTQSNASISQQREVHTVAEFTSVPSGVSIYGYDVDREKKGLFIGKTPCSFNLFTFEITEYSNITAEYGITIHSDHQYTKPVDFSNPANNWGEITFNFLCEKRGCQSEVKSLAVKATNEALVRALARFPLPKYKLEITLVEE